MPGMGVSALGRAEAVLVDPEQWGLFVDIDGTLLGVAPTPDAVSVPPGLVQLLEGVVRGLNGAAAILTGRRVADADRLFAPLQLIASGVHGTELRSEPGGPTVILAPQIPAEVIQAMNNISCIASGILVEQKGCGVAVTTAKRRSPDGRWNWRWRRLWRPRPTNWCCARDAKCSRPCHGATRRARRWSRSPRGLPSRDAAPSWSATTSAMNQPSWPQKNSAASACALPASTTTGA